MADRDDRILAVLLALGPGEVTTYGDVAETAGYRGRARLVGRLLAGTGDAAEEQPDNDRPEIAPPEIAWWRVVTAAGRLVPGHEREQAALLRAEGVVVRDGRVVDAPLGRFRRATGAAPDRALSRRTGPTDR